MKRLFLILVGGLVLLAASAAAVSYAVWTQRERPSVGWRVEVVSLYLLGALPDETLGTVWGRVAPARWAGTPYSYTALTIRHPRQTSVDVDKGRALYMSYCVACHGNYGAGGDLGADLTSSGFHIETPDSDLYLSISLGVEGTSMPPYGGSPVEIFQLVSYVRSIRNANHAAGPVTDDNTSACEPCSRVDVPSARLVGSHLESENWLTYSRDYSGQRFSHLSQINQSNVGSLRPRFVYQMRAFSGLESTPIVVDGVMFIVGPKNEVIAINLTTGRVAWRVERPVPSSVVSCCSRSSRGIAVLGNRIFHNTLDGHLIALDASNGALLFDVEVVDYKQGYSLTGAPLAVNGMIIVGVGGGDFGARGIVAAYDGQSGERVWQFWTVPEPGSPGSESWENDAWKTGGGGTWVTGTFDPASNLLYWGVGNPAPTFNGDDRPGDNLYTASVVALDVSTGELRWHYQFTPNDVNDWDASQVPVLADAVFDGRERKLMLWANRNCFYYILDRETGEFLLAKEYCKQTWNDGFDEAGRPIRRLGSMPTTEGQVIWPSAAGGSNWYPPAYNPTRDLYFVNHRIHEDRIFKSNDILPEQGPRVILNGGRVERTENDDPSGMLSAIHGLTGEVAWNLPHQRFVRSGVLATATDLIFTGSGAALIALDAGSGQEVWRYQVGATMDMPPVTYSLEGSQELAVIAGVSLYVFGLPE